MRGSRAAALVACVGIALSVAGCSGGGPAKLPTVKVSGKVTMKGAPVTEADVAFNSKERGVGAKAPLDASGNFTFPDPLEVGKYTVSVIPSYGTEGPTDPNAVAKESKIPQKYRSEAETPLTVEIKESKEGKVELPPFDLQP